MKHRTRALFTVPLRGLAIAFLAAAGVAIAAPVAQATADTTTFTYTGAEQSYTVPIGASEVTITAIGAPGYYAGGARGYGATVRATVPLPAGTTTLYVEVGGAGGPGPCPTNNGVPGGGGFNGGGGSGCGGGGGGASDVRLDSSWDTPLMTSDSRLVVAGGGGGAGAGCGGNGGAAGDATVIAAGAGGSGNDPCGGAGPGGDGGFGGISGGTGGPGSTNNPRPGNDGTLGQGGDAPTNTGDQENFGAGGGGGYEGGGAGGDGAASGGGGGAGSSFWVADVVANSTSMSEDATGVPEIQITPVISSPDLSLADSAPASVVGGRSYSYTLTATNSGNADATGVMVADTLPASVHFVSAQATQGSCAHLSTSANKNKGVIVTCAVGAVSSRSSVTVTIGVMATSPGAISDSASVMAANVDPDSDDSRSASTTVLGG